ncbi:replicative DNA helicase [Oxynema sp. CENA135]|uniref:replicative DNA helicase n=1 Tax=Oxynema sp. CENA135 TaxID=984206 RepID=UPI00351CA0E9
MVESPNFQASADRLPPQNIEAEESILGGILLDPEAINRVVDKLVPDAFSIVAHRHIYNATLDLHQRGKPTDLMTVTTWLSDRQLLEKIGGQSKLAQLVDRTVSAVNIEQYADLVIDKYIRRRLIHAGHDVANLAYETSLDLKTILDRAEQKVFGLSQERPQQGLVRISDTLVRAYQEVEIHHQGLALPGLSCGFYDLDAMTGGFQRSDLAIVAGRPAMGKCLAACSEIVLNDGSLVTIAEIVRQKQARLLTLNEHHYKFEFTEASAFIDDGIKPVFRVTTHSGRTISTTLSHPYLTPQGWRPLWELNSGDRVAVPAKLTVFGDRSLDEQTLEALAESATGDRPLPAIVFQLERSQLARFLNILFQCKTKNHLFSNLFSEIETNDDRTFDLGDRVVNVDNEKLARQLQHLLLRFGILSQLRRSPRGWRIEGLSRCSLEPMRTPVPIHWSAVGDGDRSSITLLEKRDRSTGESADCREINSEVHSEIYWDEIIDIVPLGRQQVYDLTIPKTHNFVANDICVHNTSFALNIARNIAEHHELPVAVFSLEMSKEQLVQRMLAGDAGIESNRLRSGRISQNEWEPLTNAVAMLSELPIFIDDTPNITVTEMRSKCRRLQAEQGGKMGLVLIDYLQLMEGSNPDNRVQELSKITRSLKGLARELSVPIITLSQLSRGVEARNNKRPMMSDLRESGSIEQDADLVIMLYREEYYMPDTPDRGIAEVLITKHRNGPTGVVKLLFDPHLTKFKNLARSPGNY